MINAIRDYFRSLGQRFGAAWNQFWFKPSDPLTLCVLRPLVGLVVLYWHFTFWFDLTDFFAAGGMIPPETASSYSRETGATAAGFLTVDHYSYLSYVTNPTALHVLHWIGFAVLVAFTLGLFTRATAVGAFIVALAYIHRGPMLISQLEPVMAMVLFYLCLGPCGAYLSLDRWWQKRRSGEQEAQSDAAQPLALSFGATVSRRLLQLHFGAVCFMMALAEVGGGTSNVWWSGEAAWHLAADQQSPMADLLAGRAYIIDLLTHWIFWFQLVFPVLIWHRASRPILLVLAVMTWGLLALISGYTTFCLMMTFVSFVYVRPEAFRAFFRLCQFRRSTPVAEPAPAEPPAQAVEAVAAKPKKRARHKAKK